MRVPGRRHSALPRSRQGVDGGEQVARAVLLLAHLWAQFLLQTRLLMLSPGDNDRQPLPGLQARSFVPQLRLGSGRGAHRRSANIHSAGRICGAPGRDPQRPPEQQQGPAGYCRILQGGCRGGCVGGTVSLNQRPLFLPSATGQLAYWGWVGTSRVAEAVWTAACA